MTHGTLSTALNLEMIEAAYQSWRQNPQSVDPSWQYFFEGFSLGLTQSSTVGSQERGSHVPIVRLIFAYRNLGHFIAHLDPLSEPRTGHPLLELSEFDLSEADLPRVVDTTPFLGNLGHAPLATLLEALRETYCRTIGVEYMHIQDTRIRRWLQYRMEPNRNRPNYDRDRKLRILNQLLNAETFERFLHTRYSGQKRFSLEGGETLIPLLETLVDAGPDLGVREMVLGMAHRGRLNVLCNILSKPIEQLFAQFEDRYPPGFHDGDGDVKYHLGFSADRVNYRGRTIHVSLTPNPSHLEIVDPVVEGRTRAKQTLFHDTERTWGVPVLIHGDAAFAGQGVVAETLNLSQLQGYATGGTIHIIVNNQIGFTTLPADARSTPYCTDVAKMIQAPIFHVNAEDPEATCFVTELALAFRQQFKRDVVIDMICYRRHGHNETDEPSYTQPIMYQKIRSRQPISQIYTERLEREGVLTRTEIDTLVNEYEERLQTALNAAKAEPTAYPITHGFAGGWKGLTPVYSHTPVQTGVPEDTLRIIADALVRVPEGFTVHPKVAGIFQEWRQNLYNNKSLGWPFAESLSFGSLLLEGTPVRLSGQDSRRGTFSQRHSVIYDMRTGERYSPLASLSPDQATFEVYDSLLSEAAVLGFEFGYTLDAPNTLVLWEAQFGDFSNGAQVVIDQFIASSESKWQRDSGLVMLLPHGYEGQGPEHSSARLERYLQLCAEDNMQVCYPSTPAQYFHVLRRQMRRPFRKPLILMTPKSLLRSPACVSPVQDFVSGRFFEVLDDHTVQTDRVRRVVLCSGKVYYDLIAARASRGITDVALVRVEQFYPFPEQQLLEVLRRYPSKCEWVWAQEESQNNGGWFFMEPRLRKLGFELSYVGRDASSSPATGFHSIHLKEQAELVAAAVASEVPHIVQHTKLNLALTQSVQPSHGSNNGLMERPAAANGMNGATDPAASPTSSKT
jgi:2-oxoglutarate dehydrogenase E1 component